LVLVERELLYQQLLHHHHLLPVLAHLPDQVPVQPLRHQHHHHNNYHNDYNNHYDDHYNQVELKPMKNSQFNGALKHR
jgi:hypothetical protein